MKGSINNNYKIYDEVNVNCTSVKRVCVGCSITFYTESKVLCKKTHKNE